MITKVLKRAGLLLVLGAALSGCVVLPVPYRHGGHGGHHHHGR